MIQLSCAECVDRRELLVSAGAGKTLLNLAFENNTDGGKHAASQALAKLKVTSDPRITFDEQSVRRSRFFLYQVLLTLEA